MKDACVCVWGVVGRQREGERCGHGELYLDLNYNLLGS